MWVLSSRNLKKRGLSELKASSTFPNPFAGWAPAGVGSTWARAFPVAVTGSDAYISREERSASLGGRNRSGNSGRT